jgi:Trk K+ transport system NAD-binding subunit
MVRPAASTAPASGDYRNHHVVCGLNALGLRLVEHLHDLGQQVVVVLGDTTPANRAAVESLGIPVVEGRHDDAVALASAGVARAAAMAIVADDDIGNLRGALQAAKLSAAVRIVLRLFNEELGERIKTLFEDCVILSQSAIAAPFFLAAALGEVDGERIGLAGHALLVQRAGHEAEPAGSVLFPLANVHDGSAELFPEHPEVGGEVLVDLGQFEDAPSGRLPALPRRRRSLADRWWSATATLRQLVDIRVRIVVSVMVALLAAGTVYFGLAKGLSPITSLYFAVVTLSTVGYGDINLQNDPAHVKIVGIAFIMLGATVLAVFFAILTDTIIGVRLAQILGSVRGRLREHVVVCGLSNIGFRVAQRLAEQGVPVVAVERDDGGRHVGPARRMGIPVVIGDATLTETLHAAQVESARAVVAATDNDVVDLHVAVNARTLHPHVRVILRLFDHDLSTAVEQRFDIHISRSDAVIAAPVFATAMLGHELVTTVHVAGTAVAFAESEVIAGGMAVGRSVSELQGSGDLRVLAIQSGPGSEPDWDVPGSRVLAVGDRIAVVGRPELVQQLDVTQRGRSTDPDPD